MKTIFPRRNSPGSLIECSPITLGTVVAQGALLLQVLSIACIAETKTHHNEFCVFLDALGISNKVAEYSAGKSPLAIGCGYTRVLGNSWLAVETRFSSGFAGIERKDSSKTITQYILAAGADFRIIALSQRLFPYARAGIAAMHRKFREPVGSTLFTQAPTSNSVGPYAGMGLHCGGSGHFSISLESSGMLLLPSISDKLYDGLQFSILCAVSYAF